MVPPVTPFSMDSILVFCHLFTSPNQHSIPYFRIVSLCGQLGYRVDTFSLAGLMVVPHHNSKVSFLQRELLGSHSEILCPSTSKYPPVCARYWVLRCKEFNTVIAVRDPRVSLFPTPTLTRTTECPWLSRGLSHGVLSVPGPLWVSASW